MAARRNAQAAELMEAEQAERAENADINEAIARTDSEVFTDALGDEPLEDDAGTELEDMGEGLEGDELEEDQEEQPEGEQQAAPPEGEEQPAEEVEGEEGDGEDDGAGVGEETPPPVDQRPPPSIPPRVLRETRERARETENELRAQLRDMQMRIDNLSRQPAAAPAAPQTQQRSSQPPDQFADPAGHDAWLLEEGERRAEARLEARWQQQQQLQQRDMETRLNDGLASMASGPRSYEFNVAYRDLVSLDKNPENAALVRRLVANPETAGQAILDWWETSSNPDYIEYHRDVVRQTYGTPGRPQRNGGPQRQNGRFPVQNRQVPRHEVRLPRSLSEATGGRSQHVNDPDMFDGAEDSIFAYGARR